MSRKLAYIDEFGAFGFEFEKPNVSSHFIICAIIIDETQVADLEEKLSQIQKKYFQGSEIKSSKVGANHTKRQQILTSILELDFHAYLFVVDKREIYKNSGLRYKWSFYKFLNECVYQELRVNFRELTIIADEMGGDEYKKSFYEYTKGKQKIIRTLFGDEIGESDILLVNSKSSIINQLADLVVGSIAYSFDVNKSKLAAGRRYDKILASKINRIKLFPETIDSFSVETSTAATDYDPEIAETCFRKARFFIMQNKDADSDDIKRQLIVLDYLLFRFMNNSMRKYIPTSELLSQLEYAGYERMSIQSFRNKVIAPLRDSEVIISSCKNGYKIPSTEEELCNFINHGKTIIMPMLSRLKKCNDVISMGTNGRVRLFEKAEYSNLRDLMTEGTCTETE